MNKQPLLNRNQGGNNMSRNRVFVTEDTRHNLSHALEYGEIEILATEDYPQFRDGRPVFEAVKRKLSTFLPEQDFLLLVGDPILMGVAFGALAALGFKQIRVLKWDRQATRYVPIHVPLA